MTTLALSGYVTQGTVSPAALVIHLEPSIDLPDLSIVTAADLEVHYPDLTVAGATTTWTCALTNQTSTTLTLTHPYDAADTANLLTFHIYARLTIPSGVIRAKQIRLAIVKP